MSRPFPFAERGLRMQGNEERKCTHVDVRVLHGMAAKRHVFSGWSATFGMAI